jgi:hypothetical protein
VGGHILSKAGPSTQQRTTLLFRSELSDHGAVAPLGAPTHVLSDPMFARPGSFPGKFQ